MPEFKFRLGNAVRSAKRLHLGHGVRLTFAGIPFHAAASAGDVAVVGLVFEALDERSMGSYWDYDECCEGCVQDWSPRARRIENVARLARYACDPDRSPALVLLLGSVVEAVREVREYHSRFTPDLEFNVPWGGWENRSEYLGSLHQLRRHLLRVFNQLGNLTGQHFAPLEQSAVRIDEWPANSYSNVEDAVHE